MDVEFVCDGFVFGVDEGRVVVLVDGVCDKSDDILYVDCVIEGDLEFFSYVVVCNIIYV